MGALMIQKFFVIGRNGEKSALVAGRNERRVECSYFKEVCR